MVQYYILCSNVTSSWVVLVAADMTRNPSVTCACCHDSFPSQGHDKNCPQFEVPGRSGRIGGNWGAHSCPLVASGTRSNSPKGLGKDAR